MTEALAGVRVLDFTSGMAGPLATMILRDYGAEVIRVEPAGGDPWWSHPAYLLWNRGKKSIDLDLRSPDGVGHARRLIQTADVLIESMRPGEAADLGIGYGVAAELNPSLVYVSLSAFGQEGPYKAMRAYDGIVNAKSGRMRDQVGWNGVRPHYRAVNDTSYHTAMFAVQSIVAGLRVAWMTGRGQRIETSLLRGTTSPNNTWRRFDGEPLPPDRYPAEADKSAVIRGELIADRRENDPYTANPSMLCTHCKDGRWIMHAFLQLNLFKAWMHVLELDSIWDDPRYQGAPNSFPTDQDRIDLNLMIVARMKERTSEEWIELYQQHPDCAGEIMRTTQEILQHPQFIHNGHRIELDDPRVGRMVQVGPFARMSETPAVIDTPAPFPGQHTDEVLAADRGPRVQPPAQPTRRLPKAPLEGVVMLEFASWLASPFAGALLADLGARVIKIEPVAGDPYRNMTTNENMIRTMQGKESLALDLKSPEGREILHKLVGQANIVMHNFRPGVPERLGLGYETLRAIKPDLVYVYAASFGSTGPDSKRAAFNPVIGALTGNSVFQSGEGNIPIGDQSPDPIAGSGVATGVMLGLAALLRTGKGQYVETTMMNSVVYCNSDDAFDYEGKPPRRQPGQTQLGLEATYRLYETKEGWVFLAVPTDEEFRLFCKAADCANLLDDEDFSTWAKRYEHRDELSALLEPAFRTRTAAEWEAMLTEADVGCVRADGMSHKRFLHEDPHTTAIGFMVPTKHPLYADQAPGGAYWRHGPEVDFSATPCPVGAPFVDIGEHTREILGELGFPDEEINRLKKTGVVTWPNGE